jgi:hypothetical protein
LSVAAVLVSSEAGAVMPDVRRGEFALAETSMLLSSQAFQ